MPLKFGLVPNTLKSQSGKYLAVPSDNQSYNLEDIIEIMIQRGSTVTKAEALAVIEEYHGAIENLINNGHTVNTELFSISGSIKGSFETHNEPYSPDKHLVQINIKAGNRLKACCETIKPQKIMLKTRQPTIKHLVNHIKNETGNNLSAGHIITIKGKYLKFDESDQQQGVFFTCNQSTKVRATNIIKNKPSELMLIVPDKLEKGKYQLEIRTIIYRTKSIRICKCDILIS